MARIKEIKALREVGIEGLVNEIFYLYECEVKLTEMQRRSLTKAICHFIIVSRDNPEFAEEAEKYLKQLKG